MAKTKEFTINCSSIRIDPNNSRFITITVDDPDIDDIFIQFNEDDVIEYGRKNINVEDMYRTDTLADWAERNGYTKQD